MARALIIGISGQDGAYLARLLDARGLTVSGTSRQTTTPPALATLAIADAVTVHLMPDPTDAAAIAALLDAVQPDQIYHLAGMHAGDIPHGYPGRVSRINPWLDALRGARTTRLFAAVSARAFGDTGAVPASLSTPFSPDTRFEHQSAATATAIAHARQTEGIFAVAGIMFPHESRLAPDYSLAQHIIATAYAVSRGARMTPQFIEHPDYERDIGWAPEYVDAMTRMLASGTAADAVLATGTRVRVGDIVEWAFGYFNVDGLRSQWFHRPEYKRNPLLPHIAHGDPVEAAVRLGWRAHTVGRDLIETLCEGYAAAQPR